MIIFKYYYIFVDIDECLNNSCLNGVICENLVGSFKCICFFGFIGERCESSKYREWVFFYYG